jgi:hypothetical protein
MEIERNIKNKQLTLTVQLYLVKRLNIQLPGIELERLVNRYIDLKSSKWTSNLLNCVWYLIAQEWSRFQ